MVFHHHQASHYLIVKHHYFETPLAVKITAFTMLYYQHKCVAFMFYFLTDFLLDILDKSEYIFLAILKANSTGTALPIILYPSATSL